MAVSTLALVGTGAKLFAAGRARRKLRRARKLSVVNQQLAFIQARRAFMRRARVAQAEALVAGVATGADIASSAIQGNLASLATQEAVGISEFEETERRSREIGQLTTSAQRGLNIAGQFASLTQGAADILGEF